MLEFSLVSKSDIIIDLISWKQCCAMNPSQSESFWKSLLEDDMARLTTPHDPIIVNTPQILVQQHHIPTKKIIPSHPLLPFHCLQSQQKMKSKKDIPFEWTDHLEQQLFQLHSQIGNKWSSIAIRLACPDDNCIKNKFYSTMRRGFRKLNKYITTIKRKRSAPHLTCNKLIKAEFLVKVTAVADKTYEDKYEVRDAALALSSEIQRELIQFANSTINYNENPNIEFAFEEILLKKIQQFNRNCKRRKGKRKAKAEGNRDQSDSSEQGNFCKIPSHLSQTLDISALKPNTETFNKESKDEKQFKHQEVQYPDATIVPEEKEKEAKSEHLIFEHQNYQLALNSIDYTKNNQLPFGYFTEPTPTAPFSHTFKEQACKYFQESGNLKISASSFNSTYFLRNKEQTEPIGSFVDSIPRLKNPGKTLIESGLISREVDEAYQRTQSYGRTKSNVNPRKGEQLQSNVIQSKISLNILSQKREEEQ